MTYKSEMTRAMELVGHSPDARFIGYGLLQGRALGTLKGIATEKIIETPTAENLMVGLGIGMSVLGKLPVVFIERFDFALCAADAIVNHLSAIPIISRGEFRPKVILRCVVGNRIGGLQTGFTHTQDFAAAFRQMVAFPVVNLYTPEEVFPAYEAALVRKESTMLVEYKDLM